MFSEPKPQETISGHASPNPAGSPDRRQSARHGREKGIRIFIPATELDAAGFDPDGPPPPYTTQGVRDRPSRGVVLVKLYRA